MITRKTTCRVCNSNDLKLVLDLGMTPLANSYVSKENLDNVEEFYPLQLNECLTCKNVQLAHVVDSKTLFDSYLYASSTSPVFIKHFEDFAKSMGKHKFVVDIGSNDGILLKPFQDMGCRVLGVEPASNLVASVPTANEYWSYDLSKRIREIHGQADLITATNVFAHIDDLDEVIKGVKNLLAPNGLFVVEVTDIEKMLENGSFDLIYHEHVNYWSENAFNKFFSLRKMEVVKCEKTPVHGGSIRIYAKVSK